MTEQAIAAGLVSGKYPPTRSTALLPRKIPLLHT